MVLLSEKTVEKLKDQCLERSREVSYKKYGFVLALKTFCFFCKRIKNKDKLFVYDKKYFVTD